MTRLAFSGHGPLFWLAICALGACSDAAPPPEVAVAEAALSPHDTYIVVLNDGDPDHVAGAVGVRPDLVYRHALNGFAARLPPAAVEALSRHPQVRFIERDRPVKASVEPMSTGTDRMEVDLNTSIVGPIDVDVAVIDTGVDHTHPNLNVVARTNCARGGWTNTTCRNNDGSDGSGHGTHVAGTVGATGGYGVAPGARIWAVRVLDNSGSGWTSWIIAGIDYVTANADQIEVANMSLGGGGFDDSDGRPCSESNDAQHLAICRSIEAGVVYVVAAGNERDDSANHTPAAYDEVITVSAMSDFDGVPGGQDSGSVAFSSCTEAEDDSLACFSNYGHDVDIMAPGLLIRSTLPGGGFGLKSGTSMASPHVAGLAGLYVARHGRAHDAAGVAAVRAALIAAAVPRSGPCGLATDDDPDGIAEPIALANATVFGGSGGCDSGTCANDAECGDGNACNGVETCVDALCADGTPVTCNDGDACTLDGCDAASGACTTAPVDCDDGDDCTIDSCDAATGCVNTPDPGCVQCLGNRAACTSNSECCSNSCTKNKCRGG